VGIIQLIDQEHHVWSTFARASISTANSKAVSSLVFSDDFIYSYHFTTEQWPGTHNNHFFQLLIYTRYEDGFDDNSVTGYSNIVEAMQHCLEVGCTSLWDTLNLTHIDIRELKNFSFQTFSESMEYFLRAYYETSYIHQSITTCKYCTSM